MITDRDLQHVVSQVNAKFEELSKRLEKLEAKEEKPNAVKKATKKHDE
jgi:BMFP domain-containing protein YqiC